MVGHASDGSGPRLTIGHLMLLVGLATPWLAALGVALRSGESSGAACVALAPVATLGLLFFGRFIDARRPVLLQGVALVGFPPTFWAWVFVHMGAWLDAPGATPALLVSTAAILGYALVGRPLRSIVVPAPPGRGASIRP